MHNVTHCYLHMSILGKNEKNKEIEFINRLTVKGDDLVFTSRKRF